MGIQLRLGAHVINYPKHDSKKFQHKYCFFTYHTLNLQSRDKKTLNIYTTMEQLKPTCLHHKHVALGAKMSPFGGFDMPIEYSSIKEEHQAVREACGVFDVSHMGEIFVSGPDAEKFVNHIFTNDITDAPYGKIYYDTGSHITI